MCFRIHEALGKLRRCIGHCGILLGLEKIWQLGNPEDLGTGMLIPWIMDDYMIWLYPRINRLYVGLIQGPGPVIGIPWHLVIARIHAMKAPISKYILQCLPHPFLGQT